MAKYGTFIQNGVNAKNPIKWQVYDTEEPKRAIPASSEAGANSLATKLNRQFGYDRWQVISIGVENSLTSKTSKRIVNPMDNTKRIAIEKRIIKKYLTVLVNAGYTLSVNDGDYQHKPTTKVATALEQITSVDQASVLASKGGHRASLFFVLGNAPYEVLNDYSFSLENVLAPALEYAEKFAV